MKKICYIPIDDRPVNLKRVILLGEASGFEVMTPPVDLIKTCLDDQPLNHNGTPHGDIEGLKKWFAALDHNTIDYYVLGIDQIVCGGLVNSRYFDNPSFEDSQAIIDFYLQKIKDKKTILIDSIVRLTQTAGYMGYGKTEYLNVREYGKTPRFVLQEPYNITDIINNYEFDIDGKFIDFTKYHISEEIKNKYLEIRKRKLLLNNYLLTTINQSANIYYMLGIDDSNPQITIQTNEIEYFRNRILSEKGIVFCGIDELGLMAMARLSKEEYSKNHQVSLKLHYIGGMQHLPGDQYDVGTIEQTVNNHLKALNTYETSENADLEVVMLTYKEDLDHTNNSSIEECLSLLEKLINENKQIVLMDMTSWNHYGPLQKKLLEKKLLTKVLAYSNWNTTANIVGISLSMALARYYYISNSHSHLDHFAHKAYATLLAITYLKDISYKAFGQFIIKDLLKRETQDENAFLNFYKYYNKIDIQKITKLGMDGDANPCATHLLIEAMEHQKFVTEIDKNNIYYNTIAFIEIKDYNYNWYRTFELEIDPIVKVV